MALPATDATVVRAYLATVERSLRQARAALDAGDEDAVADNLDNLVYAARQAQARTEQAAMLVAAKAAEQARQQ